MITKTASFNNDWNDFNPQGQDFVPASDVLPYSPYDPKNQIPLDWLQDQGGIYPVNVQDLPPAPMPVSVQDLPQTPQPAVTVIDEGTQAMLPANEPGKNNILLIAGIAVLAYVILK